MKQITILGSTGSVGKSTLDIIARHPEKYAIYALTAKSNVDTLFKQCLQFKPKFAVVVDELAADRFRDNLKNTSLKTKVLSGMTSLEEVAGAEEVDFVMAAIVGGAGLLPTLAAAKAGKRILLANKEALVMSGALFMETLAHAGASLLPVDSEHNAIFQCMPNGYQIGQSPSGVDKIILTASGGPFLGLTPTEFSEITPEQAVSHPTWNMGAKISVDSATLMNKGFEVIEAYWLFQLTLNQIQVVIHPQSIIHSFVCFQDGSLLAQLGAPDMRIPIAYTLSWPERLQTPVKKLDLVELGQLTFQSVDRVKFPCLDLAYAAVKTGGTASTLLNAANEIAVAAFLNRQIPFTAIPEIISEVMQKVVINSAESIEVILEADKIARSVASSLIQSS